MKQYRFLYLFLILISECRTQDTTNPPPAEFYGDPRLCTIGPTTPAPSERPLPTFPNKAEFAAELLTMGHTTNETVPAILTEYHYIYDYDANMAIIHKNVNGFNDAEYYFYNNLVKAMYAREEICEAAAISKDDVNDGTSAILLPNGTWHIRPLNEYLLFSSFRAGAPIIQPRYLGQAIVRGIPVDQWESCIVDKQTYKTVRRLWSFAQQGFITPLGVVTNLAVPIQAIINASFLFPNGTQYAEIDEIFNVYTYRPGIIESVDRLVPPRGAFCSTGAGQPLITMNEQRIGWPDIFSVRVDALSSRSSRLQQFHLRYDNGRSGPGSRRIRYDYMPPGGEDYRSIIHDYSDNLTYAIDRRTGSCEITRGVHTPAVSPILDPILFFIKHERRFIVSGDSRIWASNGIRPCRGRSIECVSIVAGISDFPEVVDPETGKPSGEKWDGTSMEYGWSKRSLNAKPSDNDKVFDYPVYLFLRFYRQTDAPGLFGIRTEDIEYEFYEMSHQIRPSDFDTSICYRSKNLEYLHISFTLESSQTNAIDGNVLDKNSLDSIIHDNLAYKMQISYARITDIDVFHENSTKSVSVFFTLLGPTPRPESPTGISDEVSAKTSQETLKTAINSGAFQFTVKSLKDPTKLIEFKGVKDSLKSSKNYVSSHIVGPQVTTETYSGGAIAGAIIGGLLVGIVIGVIIASVVRIARKKPMPQVPFLSNSFSNPLPSINFYNKKSTNDTKPTSDPRDTSAA